jgi:hypothetical protein
MADEERLRRAAQAPEERHQRRGREQSHGTLPQESATEYRRFVEELSRTGEAEAERALRALSYRA